MKKTIGLLLTLLLVSGIVFGQDQYKKINRFGIAPLKDGGVHNEEQLMDLFNKEPEAIAVALGQQDALIRAFLDQMFSVAIWYQEFSVGSQFQAMVYRSWDKKIKDIGKWEWSGEKPFYSYTMAIEYNAKRYWIIIPEDCGNIGLWKIESIELVKQTEIREWPSKAIDKQLPVLKETQQLIQEEDLKIQPKLQMNFFAGAGFGGFYSCFMEYAVGEVGVRRDISDLSELLVSIGVGVPVGKNKNDWYTVPLVNVDIVSAFFQPIYIGAGVGFSGKMKEGQQSQLEYGPDIGFRIGNWDLFVRGRLPFKGDPRGIKGNYKIFLEAKFFF